MACPPVIYVFFNRPEVTRRSFEVIRAARPPRLHLVADGPRAGRAGEAEKCAAARAIVESLLDWPCEVVRDYAPNNLGCGPRLASGLTEGFARLGEAIVLEDDCLPHPSFFDYCGELLARHRDDPEIVHINGTNLAPTPRPGPAAYRFSHHVWIWGWASWQRAWTHYDYTMRDWPARRADATRSFASPWEAQYWLSTYDRTHRDIQGANTWDFQWAAACRARRGLTLMPVRNLVSNLGFGASATHTTGGLDHLDLRAQAAGPIHAPATRRVDAYLDELFTRRYAAQPRGAWADLRSRLRIWKYQIRARSLAF